MKRFVLCGLMFALVHDSASAQQGARLKWDAVTSYSYPGGGCEQEFDEIPQERLGDIVYDVKVMKNGKDFVNGTTSDTYYVINDLAYGDVLHFSVCSRFSDSNEKCCEEGSVIFAEQDKSEKYIRSASFKGTVGGGHAMGISANNSTSAVGCGMCEY